MTYAPHSDTTALTERDRQLLAAHAKRTGADLSLHIKRLERNEPLQRILGEWEFWSLPFELSSDTLIPRPDSETLVEAILKTIPDKAAPLRLLDLGTGSGCLLIALLHELPQAHGVGIDLSEGALETARRNAERNNVAKRCVFQQSRWFDNITGTYDIILSNPPYIETDTLPTLMPQVRNHDPILALDGGSDGLQAYFAILESAAKHMKTESLLFFEIGFNQRGKVIELIEKYGFTTQGEYRDLAGHVRVLSAARGDNLKKK